MKEILPEVEAWQEAGEKVVEDYGEPSRSVSVRSLMT